MVLKGFIKRVRICKFAKYFPVNIYIVLCLFFKKETVASGHWPAQSQQ